MFVKAPFDTIGDTLRGTKGIILDMHRQPEMLLRALDVVADISIANAVEAASGGRGIIATFPLHKGADGWMSQKQFDTFYWPSLSKVIWGLIEEGIQVSLFAEGGFDTRLDSVNEFPKGTVAWLFDRTDMAHAKQVLGDNCCISGNVPASLLTAGRPEEVKEYCRKLIEVCAPGGGYILAAGTAGVDSAPIENLRAMAEAASEYGVYK
jgi:uroporphyrinogen-III decarboxylase